MLNVERDRWHSVECLESNGNFDEIAVKYWMEDKMVNRFDYVD